MGGIILLLLSSFLMTANASLGDSFEAHAIYVSVLEVEEGSGDSSTIRVKIFANDLEDAIFNQSKQRIKLLEAECSSQLSLITNYFSKHLLLTINNKEQAYTLESCEVNDISIWYTFSFNSPKTWQEVVITADYLMELFPTQSNVVSIAVGDEKRMFRLTKGATTESVIFVP